jgi:hypothetical protein
VSGINGRSLCAGQIKWSYDCSGSRPSPSKINRRPLPPLCHSAALIVSRAARSIAFCQSVGALVTSACRLPAPEAMHPVDACGGALVLAHKQTPEGLHPMGMNVNLTP